MESTTNSLRATSESGPTDVYPETLVTGRLGTAHARWNDYVGTAAADDEIAGLDRGRWTIVGIEASLADTSEQVVVYALDRSVEPASDDGALGEVGVTAFHLSPSTRVDQFLHEAFQRVSVRLLLTLAVDRALRVDAHVVQGSVV